MRVAGPLLIALLALTGTPLQAIDHSMWTSSCRRWSMLTGLSTMRRCLLIAPDLIAMLNSLKIRARQLIRQNFLTAIRHLPSTSTRIMHLCSRAFSTAAPSEQASGAV